VTIARAITTMQNYAMLKHILAGTLLLVAFHPLARADSNDDRLKRLHELYQCPIFSYLVAIHRAPLTYKDRYLVAAISGSDQEDFYAQCIFYSKDRKMHCEASSSFYHDQLKEFFTADRVKTLKGLGYTTKPSKNNYHLERKVSDLDSLYDIAGLFVETLGRVFDMQLDETLTYHAPLVKQTPQGGVEGSKFCAPMVSVR
jgi:hypothetical protein